MISLGLVILTVVVLIVTLLLYVGTLLDFIRPSTLQIQRFGIHLTLFGAVAILAFEDHSGYGFTIGMLGLLTGIFGSFKDAEASGNKPMDR